MGTEKDEKGKTGSAAVKKNGGVKPLNLESVVALLPKSYREKLISGYDLASFAKIFEDKQMMSTVDEFFRSGMNVSRAAPVLYMHRNTMIYRLKSIKKRTGLDLHNFDMAVTFKILHSLYLMK